MMSLGRPIPASHFWELNGWSIRMSWDVLPRDFVRAMNPVVRSDIVVSHFLDSVGGYRHKERRDFLLDILDVDLDCAAATLCD